MQAEELLRELASTSSLSADLKKSLWSFLQTYAQGCTWVQEQNSSCVYNLSYLLVENLVSQYRSAFLTRRPSSLVSFVSQDVNVYLLLTLGVISQHVYLEVPEVSELLMVVLSRLIAVLGDGVSQYDPSTCKPPILVSELQSFLSTPTSTLLNSLLLVVVSVEDGVASLSMWDHCLLLFSVYQALVESEEDDNKHFTSESLVERLEAVRVLIGELLDCWGSCYTTLENSSKESLRLLTAASSEEEPSGTESDRERRLQQFKDGPQHSVLFMSKYLYWLISCVLRRWSHLATIWLDSLTQVDQADVLCSVTPLVMSTWSKLKERYISMITQLQFYGVFLDVWNTWLDVVVGALEGKSHSCVACVDMASQHLDVEVRNIFTSAIAKLCLLDSPGGRALEVWLPDSISQYLTRTSVVLEKISNLLGHINSHTKQWRMEKSSSSPSQRSRLKHDVTTVTKAVGDMASSLLDVSSSQPEVQLSILCLLSGATSNPVSIVDTFLPLLSTSNIHTSLHLLERHLAVVEGALGQLSLDDIKTDKWWVVLSNFSSLMKSTGDTDVVLAVLQHQQHMLKSLPHPIKEHLMMHSLVDYYSYLVSDGGSRDDRIITAVLKTMEVALADQQCLEVFVSSPKVHGMLLSFLPLSSHTQQVLKLFKLLLLSSSTAPSVVKIKSFSAATLACIGLTLRMDSIKELCCALPSSPTPGSIGIREEDKLHNQLCQVLEVHSQSPYHVSPSLLAALSLVDAVWSMLVEASAVGCVQTLLISNTVKEAVREFAPMLAFLLGRIPSSDSNGLEAKEIVLSIMCSLVRIYLVLVRSKTDLRVDLASKDLNMFLSEVHTPLAGVGLMHLTRGQDYCTVLFSVSTEVVSEDSDGPPVKKVPQTAKKMKTKGKAVQLPLVAESGYEGDLEEFSEEDLTEQPMLPGCSVLASSSVQRTIVSTQPILMCEELVCAALNKHVTSGSLASCEVFLSHLVSLMLSSTQNTTTIAEESILDHLLAGLSPLFSENSLVALRCCYLFEQLVEMVSSVRVEPAYLKKLFSLFQTSNYHLERLPNLLLKISAPHHSHGDVYPWKPSAYITFNFSDVSIHSDMAMKISMTTTYLFKDSDRFFLSMWFSLERNSYPVVVHLVSVPINHAFLEIWACSCTGDVIVRLSPEMTWSHPEDDDCHSKKYASIVNHGAWNHLLIAFKCIQQTESKGIYEVRLTIDGQTFEAHILDFAVPSWLKVSEMDCAMLVGGGADSVHGLKALLQNDKETIQWSLSSVQIASGFPDPSAVKELYSRGPEDSTSSLEGMLSGSSPNSGDPGTDTRLSFTKAVLPYLSYSAHMPDHAFLLKVTMAADPPIRHLKEVVKEEVRPHRHSTSLVKPHPLHTIHAAVGVDGLLYLFAKVVEQQLSTASCCAVIKILKRVVNNNSQVRTEFRAIRGTKLIAHVLKMSRASITADLAHTVLDWCLSEDKKKIADVRVLKDIVLEWRIWYKSEDVWLMVISTLQGLLINSSEFFDENWEKCIQAKMVEKILMAEKEIAQDDDSTFSSKVIAHFIKLISCLVGSPPNEVCLREVWQHILVPEVNYLKFIARARHDSSFSILDTPTSPNTSPEVLSPERRSSVIGTDIADLISSDPSDVEVNIEVVQPHTRDVVAFDRITSGPDSEGDSCDVDEEEQVVVTLEEGLLREVRTQLISLQDSKISSVLGNIITFESILAIASHKSILVRTEAIKLLDLYVKRVDEGVRVSLVQSRAFDLLANQLKDHRVSAPLLSALFSITFGEPFSISGNSAIPSVTSLPTYQISALIPVLACLSKTVERPSLCQAVIGILSQIYSKVNKMATFFFENQGVTTLCQVVVVIWMTPNISMEEKNLLIKEVLQFMFAIANQSLRASVEPLQTLRALLGCLDNYVRQIRLRQPRGKVQILARTLHLLELLILQHVMSQTTVPHTTPVHIKTGRFSPRFGPLKSSLHHSNPAHLSGEGGDISSRVCEVLGVAVKHLLFKDHPFIEQDAQKFYEPVDLSVQSVRQVVTGRISTDHMDLAFAKFLTHYLHLSVYGVMTKTSHSHSHLPGSDSGYAPHFALSAKSALCEQYSTLLVCMLSPGQPRSLHSAVFRYMWSLTGQKDVLGGLLTSGQKRKVLSCRLILVVHDLLSHNQADDHSLSTLLSEIFDCVVRQKESSVIRGSLKLSTLLNPAVEADPRVRLKYETVLEDIKMVDQKGTRDVSLQKKDWLDHQSKLYQRQQSQNENRSRVIESACDSVTQQTVSQQDTARRNILVSMKRNTATSHQVLKTWRRIIMLSTTPRGLWSLDERRDMWYQVDPTEGPNRERRRLMRVPRSVPAKYFLPGAVTAKEFDPPLHYLFESVSPALSVEVEEDVLSCVFDCLAIWPDKCCKGRLIITSNKFKFYGEGPLEDPNMTKYLPSDEETVYQSWEFNEIVEYHRRRHELVDNALEFFLSTGKTIFLSFHSPETRNEVVSCMTKLVLPNLVDSGEGDSMKLKLITASWQQGEMTNFEYLMELNKLAGRSFTDLMQYPVFPFILSDYTSHNLNFLEPSVFRNFSLPIAVQNESNIARYQKHYKELQDVMNDDDTFGGTSPHHYSSHYSNSSTVLHYLVRIPPFTQLFLDFQGKSFDIADRTFHSLLTSWELSSSKSLSDVKELIPEFFYFPEFLTNIHGLNFGQRQTGQLVSDVILPPWAEESARLFVLKHRQALESSHVSKHLHEWVDLIFGFKQQGRAAVAATNVFHPSTYIISAAERSAMDANLHSRWKSEVQMYGQMPLQLFKDPHPARHRTTVLREFMLKIGSLLRKIQESESLFKNMTSILISRHMLVCRPRLSQQGQDFIGSDEGAEPVCVYQEEVEFNHPNIFYLSGGEERVALLTPRAAFVQASSRTYQSVVVTWGNWDNAVHILAFDGTVCKLYPPALDRLTCVEGGCNGQVLFTGGTLGVVSCWKLANTPTYVRYLGEVVHLRGHEGPISCLSVCRPFSIAVSGSVDGTAIIWDTNRLSYVATLDGHEGSVVAMATSPTMGDIATATSKRVNGVLMSVLRIWTVNGTFVKSTEVYSEVQCLAYTTAPEGVFVNSIVGGLRNGNIRMWSSWDLSVIRDLKCPLDTSVAVLSLTISSSSKELYAVFKDDTIAVWVKPE